MNLTWSLSQNWLVFMRDYIAMFILLFACKGVLAYQADTNLVRQQFEEAYQLNENKDFNQAAELANQALNTLKNSDQSSLFLEVGLIHILGDCALDKSDYAEAIRLYEQARSVLQNSSVKNNPLQVENFNKIGNYYREIKDFEQALEFLNQGLDLGLGSLGGQSIKVANLYNNIGICLDNIGDFDKALEYYRQALAIRSSQLTDPHPQIAQSHNNIGLCLLDKGEREEALQAFQKAVDIYSRHYGRDHQDIADVYLNIGSVYFELQDEALFTEYNKALDIYKRTLSDKHPSIALCYNNLANAYDGLNNFEKASELYQQALEIMTYNYGAVHPDVAMSHFNIGVSYFFAGKDQKAKDAYDQCLEALGYNNEGRASFDEVNDHQILLRLFKSMSDVEIESYNSTRDISRLDQAFDYYKDIDRLLDYLRNQYEASGSKLMLLDMAHDLYDFAIELGVVLHQLTNEEKYIRQAFQYSEKSKGILLLEALQKTEAEEFSGVPSNIIAEINDLERAIGDLEKQRFLAWQKASSQKDNQIEGLNDLIFEKKQLLSQQIAAVERNFPDYYNLRYETATLPVSEVQEKLLAPNQTILEYFLGGESLHIFVINKDDFRVVSLGLDTIFFNALDNYNISIRNFSSASSAELNQNLEKYVSSSYALYQFLIKPVENLLAERLLIIPDEELGFISFGALLSDYPEQANGLKTHPYLIRDYSISYNYSIRLFKEMIERTGRKGLQPYLGLAPEFEKGNENGLYPLKFNGQEIQGITKLVGGKGIYDAEASKSRFLELQSRYKIVHLATHGKANSASGDYSFLAFSETPEAKGEEALLYVREIYNMATNAEMVMLSACETSVGELLKGEGIASIARSFSYAGAQSLMATQWSVDDKATHDLVQLFFEKIKQGLSKDKAMQAAMLDFLDTNGLAKAHPYFWASFVPIGNMEDLKIGSSNSYFIWGALAVLAVVLLWFGRKVISSNG